VLPTRALVSSAAGRFFRTLQTSAKSTRTDADLAAGEIYGWKLTSSHFAEYGLVNTSRRFVLGNLDSGLGCDFRTRRKAWSSRCELESPAFAVLASHVGRLLRGALEEQKVIDVNAVAGHGDFDGRSTAAVLDVDAEGLAWSSLSKGGSVPGSGGFFGGEELQRLRPAASAHRHPAFDAGIRQVAPFDHAERRIGPKLLENEISDDALHTTFAGAAMHTELSTTRAHCSEPNEAS
jgi:hypothetical protein